MPGDRIQLLALDGGGVRGLSSLMILRRLMETVDPVAPPRPCDYFDMIGGTSTGGLIAVMLGRLRMTVDECIDAYTSLSDRVFEKKGHRVKVNGKLQGRFDAAELERAIKQIIASCSLSEDALLKDVDAPCKVFVCTTNKQTADTLCLKSYNSPRSSNSDLLDSTKIWQACRATSAATTFFDPIAIGPFGEEFVDGALGANNPIYTLWNQAQDVWGNQLQVNLGCLVSIGTGLPSLKPVRNDILGIWSTLKELTTETEKTAQQFHRDKSSLDDEGRYYRFNVDRGLEDIYLEESKKKKEIAAATRQYIESQAVFKQIKACAEKLSGQGYFDHNRLTLSIKGMSVMSAALMDPLARTTSVLAAVTRTANTLQACQRYAAHFKIADLSMASLRAECSTIRLGLHQIKSLITREGDNALESRFEAYVLEEYEGVLQACSLPFSVLNGHLENLGLTQLKEISRSDFTTKLRLVWSHKQMDAICQNIRGLTGAISILCTAFQSETAMATSEIMRNPKAKEVLTSVSSDAISLHESFRTAPGFEDGSTTDLIVGDEVFEFDDILINTELYQRVFARRTSKFQQGEILDHDGRKGTVSLMETEAICTSFSNAFPKHYTPLVSTSDSSCSHSTFTRPEPAVSLADMLDEEEKPESTFETVASDLNSSFRDFYSVDDVLPETPSSSAASGGGDSVGVINPMQTVDSPSSPDTPTTKPMHKSLDSDQYSGLPLPPDALPSIEIKVFSARLSPSQSSYLNPNPLQDDLCLVLAVYARSGGKPLWRLEKTIAALQLLDQQLQLHCSFASKLPNKLVFDGHAPANLDARRAALNEYFTTILDTPMGENTALIVYKFISTDIIRAKDANPQATAGFSLDNPNAPRPIDQFKKDGYLTKRGKNLGGWKARYFVLDGPDLRYYETPGGAHLGTIKLSNAQIGKQSQDNANQSPSRQDNDTDNQYRHAFLILEPKRNDSSSYIAHVMCAETDEDRDAWVHALLQYVHLQDEHQKGEVKASTKPGWAKEKRDSHLSISGPTSGATIESVKVLGNKTLTPPTVRDKRRSFFTSLRGKSISDIAPNRQIEYNNGPTKSLVGQESPNQGIFGIPLAQAVAHARSSGLDTYLPAVVYRCLEYLKTKNAASEEAIFSLGGSSIIRRALRDRFNAEGDVNLLGGQYNDVHAVASLLKLYLRSLPVSVLTEELNPEFLKILDLNVEKRIATLNVLVHKLPTPNFELLRALFALLVEVCNNAQVNKMTIKNIGIIFTPTLNIRAQIISMFLTDLDNIFGSVIDEAILPANDSAEAV